MLSSNTLHFQGKVAKFWKMSSKIVNEFVILQVSLHGKASTERHGKVVIEIIELVGMLIKESKKKTT